MKAKRTPHSSTRTSLTNDGFDRWLYTLYLAIDANFRLKRKTVSSDVADPGLSRGWAYFVEENKFKAHLAEYKTPAEVRLHCSILTPY
jgi:hypothetical protein